MARVSWPALGQVIARRVSEHVGMNWTERRGVVRSRLLVHERGLHNRAELLVTLSVCSCIRLHRVLGISWDLTDPAKSESLAMDA